MLIYKNRTDAAAHLIPGLEKYKHQDSIVLAIPRGGVPIGVIIARHFSFFLDLLLVKKIGHPDNPELAIGAIGLSDRIIDQSYNIPPDYIENETNRIRELLKLQYERFMGNKMPLSLKSKNVIIIDDGIATGNTIMAAIRLIRKKQPAKIILAVPVAPRETLKKLSYHIDDIICPLIPDHFVSVGQYYSDFEAVEDNEVIQLLKEYNSQGVEG